MDRPTNSLVGARSSTSRLLLLCLPAPKKRPTSPAAPRSLLQPPCLAGGNTTLHGEGERAVLSWGAGGHRWRLAALPWGCARSEKKRSLDPFLLPRFRPSVCSHMKEGKGKG